MQMKSPKFLAALAGGIAVSLFLFHVIAAEPEYELAQPVSVTVAGQAIQLPAGQAVTMMGSPNGNGDVMIKIVLPDGSLSMTQVPSTSLRPKGTGAATGAGLPPGGMPPPAAPPVQLASTPSPAGAPPPAPGVGPAPAPATTSSSAAATGGNDAVSKYNTEGGTGQAEHTDWKLVWEDDFSRDGGRIDPKKWAFQIDGKGGGNGEKEYYTNGNNAQIQDGVLVMTAKKNDMGHPFTSAKLWTKGLYEVEYGRIEACIKAPKAQSGNWPAFWMMPHEKSPYGGWPNCGEIDIMEVINAEDKLYGTDHFGTGRKQGGAQIAAPAGSDFSKDYHVYAVEWEPKEFRWYLDGKFYGKLDNWGSNGAPFPAPFNQKFYIILNYAVGGAWPKGPDNTATYPQSMYVKYVRVFQPQ